MLHSRNQSSVNTSRSGSKQKAALTGLLFLFFQYFWGNKNGKYNTFLWVKYFSLLFPLRWMCGSLPVSHMTFPSNGYVVPTKRPRVSLGQTVGVTGNCLRAVCKIPMALTWSNCWVHQPISSSVRLDPKMGLVCSGQKDLLFLYNRPDHSGLLVQVYHASPEYDLNMEKKR